MPMEFAKKTSNAKVIYEKNIREQYLLKCDQNSMSKFDVAMSDYSLSLKSL